MLQKAFNIRSSGYSNSHPYSHRAFDQTISRRSSSSSLSSVSDPALRSSSDLFRLIPANAFQHTLTTSQSINELSNSHNDSMRFTRASRSPVVERSNSTSTKTDIITPASTGNKKSMSRMPSMAKLSGTTPGRKLRNMSSTLKMKVFSDPSPPQPEPQSPCALEEVLATPAPERNSAGKARSKTPKTAFLRSALRDFTNSGNKAKETSPKSASSHKWLPKMFSGSKTSERKQSMTPSVEQEIRQLQAPVSSSTASPVLPGGIQTAHATMPVRQSAQPRPSIFRSSSERSYNSSNDDTARLSSPCPSPKSPPKMFKKKSLKLVKALRECTPTPAIPLPDIATHSASPPPRKSTDIEHCQVATSELANLLTGFNDLDADEATIASITSSRKNSSASVQQPEVPDDLQDLINAVVYESPRSSTEEALQSARLAPEDQEDLTFASKSSFEGNISTATEAAALALQKMLEGPATIGRSSNEQTIGRPSFDETTGRSSFETNFGRKSLDDGRPSYETHRTSFEYEEPKQRGTESCRSSFNRYMEMGRPSVGARMLDDIDFVVALDPLAGSPSPDAPSRVYQHSRTASMASSAFSSEEPPVPPHMPQSARSSIISLDTNESLGHSPCPGKRTRNSLRRYSHLAQSEMGQLQPQLIARPLAPRHQSQQSIDSTSGSSDDHHPIYRLKTSQRTSLLTISSVGSSPCPRPANKKVPMLTGNRLPRPGPHLTARGGFGDQGTESDTTSGSSPRYVRPMPQTVTKQFQIARPQLLSSLSISSGIIPPDTPPASSPSASEFSASDGNRLSGDSFSSMNSSRKPHQVHHQLPPLHETIVEEPSPQLNAQKSQKDLNQRFRLPSPRVQIVDPEEYNSNRSSEPFSPQAMNLMKFCRQAQDELAQSKTSFPDTDYSTTELQSFTPPRNGLEIARFILSSQDRYKSISSRDSTSSYDAPTPDLSPCSSDAGSILSSRNSAASFSPSLAPSVEDRITSPTSRPLRPLVLSAVGTHRRTSSVRSSVEMKKLSLLASEPASDKKSRRSALAPKNFNTATIDLMNSKSSKRRRDVISYSQKRLEGLVLPDDAFHRSRDSELFESAGQAQEHTSIVSPAISKPRPPAVRQRSSMLRMR